ncbi:MAG: hypothetical protein GY934_07205, partial [Gammaproteobacteria bacterium]|nr:hypothetical protein [Gammaproteobacteria bacterium]
MRQIVFTMRLIIGGMMQCCFLNAAFAIQLERPAESLIHGQQVEQLLDGGLTASAAALKLDEIGGSFLLESTPIAETTSLPSLASTPNSQQSTADLQKIWHSQSSGVDEFEQTGYDEYWDTFDGSSVMLGDVLRLYVNTDGGGGFGRQSGGQTEGSRGQHYSRQSPGLIRYISNISLQNEH